MPNPLRIYFWMLGQDARLGLLTRAGFRRCGAALYQRDDLWLHQLGMVVGDVLYVRDGGRFFRVRSGHRPPDLPDDSIALTFRQGWAVVRPVLMRYESWVRRAYPQLRRRLLRICPPALKPLRRGWERAFSAEPPTR